VALEMRNDFGPDSGLFLRSDDKGRCYQAMIDYQVNERYAVVAPGAGDARSGDCRQPVASARWAG
jgi:hypothetical protein